MLRYSTWTHALLTAYLWVLACVPLCNWNRQRNPQLIPAVLGAHGVAASDLFMMVFVTIPAVLFWATYRQRRFWIGLVALGSPYLLGTNTQWQLDYAKGPTTKLLPSFGRHVAPDGMHSVIGFLLLAALITGVIALRQLRQIKVMAAKAC